MDSKQYLLLLQGKKEKQGGGDVPTGGYLLLETGGYLLLENGGKILLEEEEQDDE